MKFALTFQELEKQREIRMTRKFSWQTYLHGLSPHCLFMVCACLSDVWRGLPLFEHLETFSHHCCKLLSVTISLCRPSVSFKVQRS